MVTASLEQALSDGRPIVEPGLLCPDTGRILAMSRPQLEGLVAELCRQRGDMAIGYESIDDDELRSMARRLRPSAAR